MWHLISLTRLGCSLCPGGHRLSVAKSWSGVLGMPRVRAAPSDPVTVAPLMGECWCYGQGLCCGGVGDAPHWSPLKQIHHGVNACSPLSPLLFTAWPGATWSSAGDVCCSASWLLGGKDHWPKWGVCERGGHST